MKYGLASGSVRKGKMEIVVHNYYKGGKSMIRFKQGDLLDATEDIIAHQVNCYGAAGGLAGHIFDKYRGLYKEYLDACETENKEKLLGMVQIDFYSTEKPLVANLFGQLYPGADYRPDALRKALAGVAYLAKIHNLTVALPYRLSCGIAGGDWQEVLQIIDETMEGVEVTIYRRDGD